MEVIGAHIVRLQELIHAPMIPPPQWARKWQAEAEHVLHLAQNAKDADDLARLRELDDEAKRMIGDREERLTKKK